MIDRAKPARAASPPEGVVRLRSGRVELPLDPGQRPSWRNAVGAAALAMAMAVGPFGCKASYDVGDHVLVEWEGKDYPAYVTQVPGAGRYKVHYDGYDAMWDETVPRERVKGRVTGTPPTPEPPAKVRGKAIAASITNVYKIGDRVRVEWHGQIYPATIVGIVGVEQYRVHYEGYGAEWDESVGANRIQAR